ncbi:hypothetical protein [Sphingomonas mucosissima]|uniref:Uncharacterized protein n=1 Tax=Sphingomonas mucosissima TaxID=370959 RepID=A0A245ZEZ2_9SPHN|nr:hypothetical protein [Sphingomonas mucosissima]OWK28322.1 hypothetical protein SPMU_31780 [Sphingomonas mucosissima]
MVVARVREIIDALGSRVRIGVERHAFGGLVTLERPDRRGCPRILLDIYGAETLTAYIMSARLSADRPLTEEIVTGAYPMRVELEHQPAPLLRLVDAAEVRLDLPAPLWDRLYAELNVALAHVREMDRRSTAHLH